MDGWMGQQHEPFKSVVKKRSGRLNLFRRMTAQSEYFTGSHSKRGRKVQLVKSDYLIEVLAQSFDLVPSRDAGSVRFCSFPTGLRSTRFQDCILPNLSRLYTSKLAKIVNFQISKSFIPKVLSFSSKNVELL